MSYSNYKRYKSQRGLMGHRSYILNVINDITAISDPYQIKDIIEFFKSGDEYDCIKVLKLINPEQRRRVYANVVSEKHQNLLFITAMRHSSHIFNTAVEIFHPFIKTDFVDSKGCDLFMHLVKDGDIEKLKLLDLLPLPNFTRKDEKARTLKDLAIESNSLEMFNKLNNHFYEKEEAKKATSFVSSEDLIL